MIKLIKDSIKSFKYSMLDFSPYFFTNKPLESKEYYSNLCINECKQNYEEINKFEKSTGYKIENDWLDNLAKSTQIVIKKSKLNYQHGKILYSILRNYIEKNSKNNITVFETGTSRGFSAICMSKAINDSNIIGKIITFDILPHNKKMYWNIIFDHDGMQTRSELLSKWPIELSNIVFIEGWTNKQINKTGIDRIHFAFLDAQHEYENVIQEYIYCKARQLKDDIIVFDDVSENQYDGVFSAVKEIEKQGYYNIEYIKSSDKRGYAIARKK